MLAKLSKSMLRKLYVQLTFSSIVPLLNGHDALSVGPGAGVGPSGKEPEELPACRFTITETVNMLFMCKLKKTCLVKENWPCKEKLLAPAGHY